MANFKIDIPNLNNLVGALNRYPSISAPILQRAIEATGIVFEKHTHRNDPVPWRTGVLLQSFRFSARPGEARWYPTANYAAFVEFGTRPHDILPVKGRFLRWEVGGSAGYVTASSGRQYYRKQAGTYILARKVRHPGTRAQPFMAKIVEASKSDVDALFTQAGDIINRQIAEQAR